MAPQLEQCSTSKSKTRLSGGPSSCAPARSALERPRLRSRGRALPEPEGFYCATSHWALKRHGSESDVSAAGARGRQLRERDVVRSGAGDHRRIRARALGPPCRDDRQAMDPAALRTA